MTKYKHSFFVEWAALFIGSVTDRVFDFSVVEGGDGQCDAISRLEHTLYMVT